jgi:hypothetical protein
MRLADSLQTAEVVGTSHGKDPIQVVINGRSLPLSFSIRIFVSALYDVGI